MSLYKYTSYIYIIYIYICIYIYTHGDSGSAPFCRHRLCRHCEHLQGHLAHEKTVYRGTSLIRKRCTGAPRS